MSIDVNKENVKRAILNINGEYPTVFNSLKAANNTFDDMKNYWYGERYQKIADVWNETIPTLNSQLQILSDIAKTMSSMFKNYTMADTDTITVQFVAPEKLTVIDIKKDPNIKIDQTKLTQANATVTTNIDKARTSINKIVDYALNADWRSPAVDTLNTTVNKIHKELITGIDKIRDAVKDNLKTTVDEFNEADKASTVS